MKTPVRALLAILAVAGPLHAAPLTISEKGRETAVADRSERVAAEKASAAVTAPELQARVEALETELARLQSQELERFQTIGDPDSHPLWP
jgi:Flp pilus assembly protein TadB